MSMTGLWRFCASFSVQQMLLSDGELEWADGMLYPILHRLEERQQIQSYWCTSENGRKRKYYRLRESGLKELAEQRSNWDKLHAMLTSLRGGPACLN